MNSSTVTRDSAFTRKRVVRVGAGVASAGVMAGFSLVGATPAMAYTDEDCTIANTASVALGYDEVDIQNLLNDATLPVICLDGTFVLTTGLTYDRSVTIHGLPGATLDGDDTWRILEDLDTDANTLTIESLRLTHGFTSTDSGGAIDGGYSVIVHDSVLDFNESDFFGGAISAYSVDIFDSLFEENTSAFGGAVAGEFRVTSTRSTFQHNDGVANGGAIHSYGFVSSDSSTFFDNEAGAGGAIYLDDDIVQPFIDVENSTFVDNTAPDGGGAIVTTGGTVLQSTFVNNRGDGQGESIAIYNDEESEPAEVELRANLFTGDSEIAELYFAFGPTEFTDLGGNLFSTEEATEVDFTVVEASSRFQIGSAALYETGALGDNGGPTQTVALSAGSLAIDAVPVGEPSVEVDQRGVARTALSDSGAYEYEDEAETPVLASTGVAPAGWLGGAAALLLAVGAVAFGVTRRTLRLR